MEIYFYCGILLFIAAEIVLFWYLSLRAPSKIKIISIILGIMVFLRYFTLVVFYLKDNIIYLYLFKPLFFMQYIYIPLIAFITIYIFMKKVKINFSYIFIVLAVLLVVYLMLIIKVPVTLEYIENFGYTMNFKDSELMNWIYLGINTLVLLAVLFFRGWQINRGCLITILITSVVSIVEIILFMCNMTLEMQPIIGEICWLLTYIYALNKVKK